VFILLQIVVWTLADLGRNEPARWYKFFNETVYFVTAGLGAKNPGPEHEQQALLIIEDLGDLFTHSWPLNHTGHLR
jgi:hypothetical protein